MNTFLSVAFPPLAVCALKGAREPTRTLDLWLFPSRVFCCTTVMLDLYSCPRQRERVEGYIYFFAYKYICVCVRPRDIAKGEANFVPARSRAIDFDRFSPSFFFFANFIFVLFSFC